MLVITRCTQESFIFRPDNPATAARFTLARVSTEDVFARITCTASRHKPPELDLRFPDRLLRLDTGTQGRETWFDLLIRPDVDPREHSLAALFTGGPIRATLRSHHQNGIRFAIKVHREIAVVRGELLGSERHREDGNRMPV